MMVEHLRRRGRRHRRPRGAGAPPRERAIARIAPARRRSGILAAGLRSQCRRAARHARARAPHATVTWSAIASTAGAATIFWCARSCCAPAPTRARCCACSIGTRPGRVAQRRPAAAAATSSCSTGISSSNPAPPACSSTWVAMQELWASQRWIHSTIIADAEQFAQLTAGARLARRAPGRARRAGASSATATRARSRCCCTAR